MHQAIVGDRATGGSGWGRNSLALGVVACLLALAAANISLRASWHEVEDGVLWVGRPEGVVAAEVAPRSAAALAGIGAGDVLLAANGRSVTSPDDVLAVIHGSRQGQTLSYTVWSRGTRDIRELTLQPAPEGNRALYFFLAAIAIFTLLVGMSVRLRRPHDPTTLHFFWLCVAFFGVFAFSFSGRLDRLDWTFYWADVVAMVLLPPLFLHFALVFPDRPGAWVRTGAGRWVLATCYLPGLVLVAARIAALVTISGEAPRLTTMIQALDRLEMAYLAAGIAGGFGVMLQALTRVRLVTARRQLRWIVWGTALGGLPFVVAYGVPWAFGLDPWTRVELLVLPLGLVPLAYASAVVRYRLMDVEVIVKRGVTYAVAVAAIVAIYAVLLKIGTEVLLGGAGQYNTVVAVLATLVAVLLAPMVKSAIQATLDRAHYRDRYDYRRALVGFARDLNSDLDLERLSVKLVERVRQSLELDRMALLISSASDGAEWVPLHAEGVEPGVSLRMSAESGVGGRLADGGMVDLDDHLSARRFTSSEVDRWKAAGVHAFVPCVSKDGTIAIMALGTKESGEPLSSEDTELLLAVAGQVATALENGRLYQQLRVKADELHRLREFSENIIASLTEGLFVAGLDDRIVRWNPALEVLYGVPRASAVGRPMSDLFDDTVVAALRQSRHDGGGSGTLYRVPVTSRHDAPRHLLVNVAIAPLRTPDGAVAGTIVIIEDTTERVKLEEQLQISDKMASIGLLAAGVAHEVNTPLTGISSYTQMLLEGADPDDPRARLLEKIEKQTFRAAKIVNGLLNLSRPVQGDAGPVDLHTVIGDVLSLLEHQFKSSSIQLRRDLAAESPCVHGLEHKLQQVFLNLFLNARDAMPKGGWLSIVTRNLADQAVVEVSDTGSGIPMDLLSRIYDPFFTTKPIGQGTGLGLSITYGIVQEHNGTITCESTPGQGTRFVLSLPLAARRQRAGQVAR
jgi:two-component system NtrC family sensor kinase